jgi:hypothetical protein
LIEFLDAYRQSSQAAQGCAVEIFSRLQIDDHRMKGWVSQHAIAVSIQRRTLINAHIAMKAKYMGTQKVSCTNTALQ